MSIANGSQVVHPSGTTLEALRPASVSPLRRRLGSTSAHRRGVGPPHGHGLFSQGG